MITLTSLPPTGKQIGTGKILLSVSQIWQFSGVWTLIPKILINGHGILGSEIGNNALAVTVFYHSAVYFHFPPSNLIQRS